MYEHAEGPSPRREHGYCLDDVARALVVVCREQSLGELDDLRDQYLTFVLAAQEPDGRFHNRRRSDLRWSDTASVEDCWGRGLWGLGTAVARAPRLRERALAAFDRGARLRSPHPRAMAFAALGAAEVLAAVPDHVDARALLVAAVDVVGRPALDRGWPWPEPRLSYANAALPEALLAAGAALDSPLLVADGLGLLDWLLDRQTRDGHLSVVPVGGCGPGTPGRRSTSSRSRWRHWPTPAQRLSRSTADAGGPTGSNSPRRGSSGDNDSGTSMHDPVSGGGYDGLERFGRNENQGAESTLALLSTLQLARSSAASMEDVG